MLQLSIWIILNPGNKNIHNFFETASNNISVNLYFDLPFYYFLQFLPFPSLEEVKHGKVFGYFLYIKRFFIFWYAFNWWK